MKCPFKQNSAYMDLSLLERIQPYMVISGYKDMSQLATIKIKNIVDTQVRTCPYTRKLDSKR